MGTLKTVIDRARIKARDTEKMYITDDDDLISIVNGILDDIYKKLCQAQSNLVYAIDTVTTVDGTPEYVLSFTHNGFLVDGSWVDGETLYLSQVSEADKIKWDYDSTTGQPEAFYITEDDKVGYLWVPDDAYTIYHTYWKPLTEMSTYASDTLPWLGIWDSAIERQLVVEMLEIMEKDNSRASLMAEISATAAMNTTYARGVRQQRQVSDMFLGGIGT